MSTPTRIFAAIVLTGIVPARVDCLAGDAGVAKSPAPIAPRFHRLRCSEERDPPEVALWPPGVIELLDVTETVDDRGDANWNRFVRGVREPTVSVHRAHDAQAAIVVCPGGGYTGLAIDKEGHDTARWLNSLGVTAAVLKYRCWEYGHPAPTEDVQHAVAWLRSRAPKMGFPADRVGVLGYSAGGHVASTAGAHVRDIEIGDAVVSSRPDFMVLVYPVISMDEGITHGGSRRNLLGDDPNEDLVHYYSSERHVSGATPPTFLVHTVDDPAVSVENSRRMLRALRAARVPVELALYQRGGHGFGLVSAPGPVAGWPARCEGWLRAQGILGAARGSTAAR